MSSGNNSILHYSHQNFRPEAVEAYSTRQAGEPWDAKDDFENWGIAGLTLLAGAALAFLFLGGR
jgi:hypothetical protein